MTVQRPTPHHGARSQTMGQITEVASAIGAWLRANRAAPGTVGPALTPEQLAFVAQDVTRGVSLEDFTSAYLEVAERGFVELAAVRARAHAKAAARGAGAADPDKGRLGTAASARQWHAIQDELGRNGDDRQRRLAADDEASQVGYRRPPVEVGPWGVRLACGHTVHAIRGMEGAWRHCRQCQAEGAPSSWREQQRLAWRGGSEANQHGGMA